MYAVSSFTPLFFNPTTDRFGAGSKYMQIFASSDQILIEVIAISEYRTITGKLYNLVNGTMIELKWNIWSMNDTTTLYYYVLTGIDNGYYTVELNGIVSEIFRVTNDAHELSGTTLIQYSMNDNRQRKDGVFWIAGKQYFFDWRVPGGFKDTDWIFGVNNEQFTTTDEDVVDLFSNESTQRSFTLGNAAGCPVWFADLLNRIMSCSYVYFDGQRYVRKDSSVPEMTQELENIKSYIFKILLQEVKYIDRIESENLIKIRRVESDYYRTVTNKLLIV